MTTPIPFDDPGFGSTPGALPDAGQLAESRSEPAEAIARSQVESFEDAEASLQPASATADARQRSGNWMTAMRGQVQARPLSAVAAAFVTGMLFDRLRRPGALGHRR